MKISVQNGAKPEKMLNKEQRQVRLISILLLLGTFFLYSPVITHGFITYDDQDYVPANLHVRNGLSAAGVVWAFTTTAMSNWHPLTWISHMIDCQIFGVEHPGGHHFTNLIFHLANTLLVFLLLRRMTGGLWRSAVVAALFAWHPLHVESVAWIAERKDVLSALFWLLTLYMYVRYAEELRTASVSKAAKRNYYWALLFFALGLMSKPMVVTLPFVLLLLDFWPLRRLAILKNESTVTPNTLPLGKLILEKLPFFLLAIISSVVTFVAQREGGSVMAMEKYSLGSRIANALLGYAGYLWKMIWPKDLAVFYPFPQPLPMPHVMIAAVVLVVISILAIAQRRSRPYLLFGWLWFLGTLVPVIGLVQVGSQSMADRYTYLPLIGIFIMLTWGLADLMAASAQRDLILKTIATLALVTCGVLTFIQLGYWENSFTLFTHALAVTPDNYVARDNLGQALESLGKRDEGLAEYKRALALQPDSSVTLYLVGLNFARRGDYQTAIDYYQAAMKNGPVTSSARYNFGNALVAIGKPDEAMAQYDLALKLEPDSPDVHNNLGALLARKGQLPEALAQFKNALRLQKDYPEAQDEMGGVYLRMGRPDLAQLHYEEAVRLKPDFAHAQLKLGLVLAEQGYLQESIPHLLLAVRLAPENVDAYYNLGAAFAALERYGEAADVFGEVIRLKPTDAQAHARLAEALANQGKLEAAISAYREALRLRPETTEALTGLAWIYATSIKPDLLNGAEAVRLAEQANALTGHQQVMALSSLDAAYAEVGRFDEAIKTAEQARQIATTHNQKKLADRAAHRLELYHAGKPFRQG